MKLVRTLQVGLAVMLLASGVASGAAVPPDRLDQAIARAKKWIYSRQRPGGRWEKDDQRQGSEHAQYVNMQGDTFGGYTALATYALLASGESPNDPRIKAAVRFLKQADIVGIYGIAMRCQVWLLIPHQSEEMKGLIRADAERLFAGLNDGSINPANNGLWDYLGRGPRVDHSVSQYGVLGLWACQQTGAIDVGSARWRLMEKAWRDGQHPEGGWDYGTVSDQTPSMTAAGLASLFIISDYLHADEGVACTGNTFDPWIDNGLAWLDRHFDRVGDNTYAMYGIERIGAASGYRYFGSRDWYNTLAAHLLKNQSEADGSFLAGDYSGAGELDSTCFALLFLSRGRAPVMMSKLDYHHVPPGAIRPTTQTASAPAGSPSTLPATLPALVHWNERPRDVANLAAWTGRQTETFLQWQIVNLAANPNDLHDAPVIYLSGNRDLDLTGFEAARVKRFIEEGGMLLGNADCGQAQFAHGFQRLGRRLFGGEFRELPADHPAFTHQQFPAARWRSRPRVLGLSNGVRELMVLIPDFDAARWWQSAAAKGPHEDAFELGTDLYQYSIDRQLWNKGASYIVRADPQIKATRSIRVARLAIGTNWDPEPGGWRRLAAVLQNQDEVDLSVFAAKTGDGTLATAQIAHLTGTTDFSLSAAARAEIQAFVRTGGTLVVDAAGGSLPFADAAERELRKLFGPGAVRGLAEPLPADHPVFRVPGHVIDSFSYRAWARLMSVGSLKKPRLRAIHNGTRIVVFFSREDLSAGLVGEPVDGIVGYSPQTATQIVQNILLYSVPGPTTRPASPADGAESH